MLPNPLSNSEMQKYQNKSKFNGVYSRIHWSKIKDVAYIITFG